ncbi:MAG: Nramp family divalent metal transporter [Eubacteriales bacterium]
MEFLKYIGPGLLVTVGFIDPGNWASNVAAGSSYGYTLLWVVTLSTVMLILLQHNAAHLGIVTGFCLSESASIFLPKYLSLCTLSTAMLAAISTAMAEILGGAIALAMLFNIPIKIGATMVTVLIAFMLLSNSYKKIEKWIIGFVSLIGISFLIELSMVHLEWNKAVIGWVNPGIPTGAIFIIMSILGAVVMPHNLFLHSEIIQSRQWNLKDEKEIKKQLKFEFTDTLFSMIVGWAINSAMILLAAATFFKEKVVVTDLAQAVKLLEPLLNQWAGIIFAVALLFAGIASTTTVGIAGGSIFSGIFKKPYDIKNKHTIVGISVTIIPALIIIFFITDTFKALLVSQMLLSIQLPITIFLQIYLTSSERVMGKYANRGIEKILLITTAIIVALLNFYLLFSFIFK